MTLPRRVKASFGPLLEHRCHGGRLYWFAGVVVHAGGQTAGAITLHGVGRHGDDGDMPPGLGLTRSDTSGRFVAI